MRGPLLATLLLCACGGAAPAASGAQAPPSTPTPASERGDADKAVRAALATRLDELVATSSIPGIAVGYALANGSSGALAAGLADIEARTALAPDSRMLLGSVGKTYVAAVTLQLASEGVVALDEPVARWLGEHAWFERVPNARDLTLRHLLRHRTGIPRHIFTPDFLAAVRADPDRVWQPAELVSYVLDAAPTVAVDEGFSYADTNYILVGMVIEAATGHSYYDELARRVLEPYAFARTEPSTSREMEGLVPGYSGISKLFGDAPMVNVGNAAVGRVVTDGRYFINPQLEWTGGGLVTTPEELARWAAELYGGSVLDAQSRAAMFDGRPSPPLGGEYGLGVQLEQSEAWGQSVGHEGIMPGYSTVVRYFPAHRVAVAMQINTDAAPLLGHKPTWYMDQVAAAVLGALASPGEAPSIGENGETQP